MIHAPLNFLHRVLRNEGGDGLLWTGSETGVEDSGPVDLPPDDDDADQQDNIYYDVSWKHFSRIKKILRWQKH